MGFLNSCRFVPTAGGTTDWTYSSAVLGFQSPAAAGAVNGTPYSIRAESADGTQWEDSQGNFTSATGVFARTVVLYNSSGTGTGAGQTGAGTKISFSTVPQVQVVALAEDLRAFQPLDADLTALAGLATAADTLPYFTGAGAAALATYTAFSRTLDSAANAAAAQAALGLTSAATATPSALTKTDDTNVTLTLGGTPATALLQAASLTLGWTGTLAAARGGFGANISAANGVPLFATGVATFTGTTGTGNFARAADPVFTGVPSAPTAAVSTNTTQLATTAFVLGQVGTANPIMDGAVAVGTSLLYARQDHVHPTDTSRAPTASPTFTGTLASANQTITSTSANANAIGPAGTTNPTFNVDCSTASAATGLNIKSAAAAAGLALSVLSSGLNENLTLDAKGTGTITINGTATGAITLARATTISAALTYGGVALANSVTGTGSMVLSASPTFTGTLSSANQTITSASANANTVGPSGTTNPTFNVDCSTASAATGLNIKSAAAAAGLALSVLSSGANENLTINAKGTGTITFGSVSTGAIVHTQATTLSAALTYGGVALSNAVTGTGNMVLSAGPTLTGTITAAALTLSGVLTYGGVALSAAVTGTGSMVLSASPIFTGTVTAPLIAGGSAVSSTLTLQSTTATGTSDAIILRTGAQVERLRILTTGEVLANFAGSTTMINWFYNAYSVDGTNNPGAFYGGQFSNDAVGFYITLAKSRGTTVNANTIVALSDNLGQFGWNANHGTGAINSARLDATVDAAPVAGQRVAARIGFWTATTNASATEKARIASGGNIYVQGAKTTASAANTFINTASSPVNELLSSTSSLRYKKDVEPVDKARMDATLAIEPIWFRSLASADDPSWSFYGLAAEDVAEIDPRLVNWGYRQEDYTLVIRQQGKQDEYGEYVRNPDAKLVPDGVQYDRVAILQIAALKARIEALEQRL